MADEAEQLTMLIHDCILRDELRKAVLSKPSDRSSDVSRIDVRPIQLRERRMYQFASRAANQELHRNLTPDEAIRELVALTANTFRNAMLQTTDAVWNARRNKKGACSLKRQALSETCASDPVSACPVSAAAVAGHDRARQYLIPDGVPVPFLVATGIMSNDGRVRARHFRKFRQINRYVEFVRDVVDRLPNEGALRVVDFGCGKSYLTFATHYLLTNVLHRDVSITGLDCRADVVETCRKITTELQLSGLDFAVGDIASYDPDDHVHLTISLHACDMATDDALAKAVLWGSDVILAVPCCQHELAAKLSQDAQPVLSRHGILHERFCAMATDAIRASLLEQAGYSTIVQEFVDMQHTPKNILIRAIRRSATDRGRGNDVEAEQLRLFSASFHVPALRLQRQLEEYGILSPVTLPAGSGSA